MMYRISIDVGGTFTDCLVMDGDGGLRQFKAYTTPPIPPRGSSPRSGRQPPVTAMPTWPTSCDRCQLIIHGTTLATNTLINRNGARTGMVTTRGFRDIVEIRRGYKNIRTSMYNVFVPPYEPLVPRHLRLEASERSTYEGEVVTAARRGRGPAGG